MNTHDIDTQIALYESELDRADSGEDMSQLRYELAKLRFDRQLMIVKERLDEMSARPSTRELLNKFFPIKF